MGLLKNGVGRPSNETLKKRKILILIIIGLVVTLLVGTGYFFKQNVINSNSKNASGKLTTVTKNGITFKYNKKLVYSGDYEAPFKYNFGVTKSNKGKTIYAKIAMYRNGKFLKSTNCRKYSVPFSESKYLNHSYAPYEKSSYYAEFIVYSDAKCSKKISSVKTDSYKTPIYYPLVKGYSDVKQSQLWMKLGYNIHNTGSNTPFYYKTYVYSGYNDGMGDGLNKTISCRKVKYGAHEISDVVFGTSRYATIKIEIFTDSKCSKGKKTTSIKDIPVDTPLILTMFNSITYKGNPKIAKVNSYRYGDANAGFRANSFKSASSIGIFYETRRNLTGSWDRFENTYYSAYLNTVDSSGRTTNSKKIATCKKGRQGEIDAKLSFSSSKHSELKYTVYYDSKCKNKLFSGTLVAAYYKSKPTISKVCKSGNYVKVDMYDDMGVAYFAWTTVGSSCSKATKFDITNGFYYQKVTSRNIPKKINTTKDIKVCVWDVDGNVSEKRVSGKC